MSTKILKGDICVEKINDYVYIEDINQDVLKNKDIKCLCFECKKDLTPYVDSLLFDNSEEIAFAEFLLPSGKIFNIELTVNGEVDVFFKGSRYRSPSEFPKALVERIKNDPYYNCDADIDIIGMNNWFEYCYGFKEDNINIYQDGSIYEADLSKDTQQGIFNEMVEILKIILN